MKKNVNGTLVSEVAQVSARAIPPGEWEVAIVGAGPAGTTAAIRLAEAGRRVLLIDAARFPREKVCGDGLLPDALRVLRRLGLEKEVRAAGRCVGTLSIFSPSRRRVELPSEGVVLRRELLDALLARRAVAAGALFAHGEVTDVERRADGALRLEVAGGVSLSARYGLLATGTRLRLARRAGLAPALPPEAVAVRRYVRSAFPLDQMVVSYDRSILPGYAWLFPVAEGLYNVGCGVFYRRRGRTPLDLAAALDTFVNSFPLARELLAAGEFASPLRGAGLRCGLRAARSADGALLAAGEVLGTTFPYTGEGIGKALESGELAAEALLETLAGGAGVERYAARLAAELEPRYRGYRIAEDWLARPWLADLLAWRANRSAWLRGSLAAILAEGVDPSVVFSAGGLWRSLWT
jgi:geranylgeranyl reductase family protein